MLGWLLGLLLAFRRPPTCKCGRELDDIGECHHCEWEEPESGPPSLPPRALRKRGIGH